VIEVEGVDYIRVPATDIAASTHFYGEVLGLPYGPTQHDDWVEYQAGNVTLAVMTPETHEYEFAPLPPATIALGVPDVAAAKAQLEAAGIPLSGGPIEFFPGAKGIFVRDPDRNVIELRGRAEDLSKLDGVTHYTP